VNDFSKRGGASIDMTNSISRWLLENRIAKEIKVKALTSRHFEICLVDFKDKEHNLCDVGFGCSQVLPVLVAGLQMLGQPDKSMKRPGIFLVQEPEIHLHPNAQASLGSFFTSLAHSGVQVFVETHSEYLVLRVATEVAKGNILPTDVRVFYVRDNDGEKDVTAIDLDENGVFQTDWPDGFFPHRFAETKALAAARQGRLFND
jgi:predicted ATPase